MIQSTIENGYRRFLKLVADGRDMSVEQVAGLAEGRVWSGEDAQQLGLVDHLGGLQQAVESAAALAKLESYKKYLIQIPLTPQEQFLKELSGEVAWYFPASTAARSGILGQLQQWLKPLKSNFEFISHMNDPQGVYLHCGFCAAL
nr:S49 family peptidase [Oceanicoccus sp. KOV_DT_Chl]